MTTLQRAAVALGALLVLGAVAATFLPTSPEGVTCGTWVSPEWSDSGVDELVGQAEDLAEEYGDFAGAGDQAEAMAANALRNQRLCDDALSTRRTVSLVLLGLAVLVPASLLFVGGGQRRDA